MTASRATSVDVSSKCTPRAEAQQERILAAAETCFYERGFHAASMAHIAETAGMSPGLIYRYFKNKSAIVQAIIDKQLVEARTVVQRIRSSEDLVTTILDIFDHWKERNPHTMNSALFIEMTAEAARDPEIGRALHDMDAAIRRELRDWLTRDLREHGVVPDAATVDSRVLMLQTLIEGLAIRVVRQPTLDRETLRTMLERFAPILLGRDG